MGRGVISWPLEALVRQGHRRKLLKAQEKNRLKQQVLFLEAASHLA